MERLRPRRGHRLERARSSSRSASRSSGRARGSRRSRQPATGPCRKTSRRSSRSGSARTATGATTRRTSARASCVPSTSSSSGSCSDVYERAIEHCRPGASLAELDRLVRGGIAEAGYPGQPSHPVCHGVGARAHEPPYAHQAGGGTIEEGMVLAIEPGHLLGRRRRAPRRGQLPRSPLTAPRSSRPSPTEWCADDLDGRAQRLVSDRWAGRPLRHDAARRRADRRRRARSRAEARDCTPARRPRNRSDRGRLPTRLAGRLGRRPADLRRGLARRDLGFLAGRAGRSRGARGARRRPLGDRVADLGSQA